MTGGIPYDYVICMECGKRMKSVEYSHLIHKHGMTIEEYERKWYKSPRVCINTLLRLGRIREAKEMAIKWYRGEITYNRDDYDGVGKM